MPTRSTTVQTAAPASALKETLKLSTIKTESTVIKQKPFLESLPVPLVAISAIVLCASLFKRQVYLAGSLLVLVPLLLFVRNDYENFLRLGPGGIPSTPLGYCKTVWLGLFVLRDPYKAPVPRENEQPSHGVLQKAPLPSRAGPRPVVVGIAPHRQIDQHGSSHCSNVLNRTLRRFVDENPDHFHISKSTLEKHGQAFFAKSYGQDDLSRGEIAHIHEVDHSLHLNLHPDDIKETLEKGWGLRHPMAWRWGPWKPRIGPNFVMIYGPRGMCNDRLSSLSYRRLLTLSIDENEIGIVCRLIEAAAWSKTGKEVRIDVDM